MRSFALSLISYVAMATKLTSMSKVKTDTKTELCHDCHRHPSME